MFESSLKLNTEKADDAPAMPIIRTLPTDLVNQIAAGEVLERPASAVKELVENSIDAGASRIIVELLEGGRELIRVVDDGCGIPADQLPLAVASHATSKLDSKDDLFRIRTLGFRGEALASIAGVSVLTIRSRPIDQEFGAEINVRHGVIGPVRECGCPIGTQIEIRDLFGSVPVRRKFLKGKASELGHAMEAIVRLALANPGVGITIRHQERLALDRPGGLDRRTGMGVLLGRDVSEAALPIEGESAAMRLFGFACHPSVDRANARTQYFFVNGRWFRDRSLNHAVQEAYRGLIMTGRYPVVVLHLEMPAEDVDVNVHPQKSEVRFVDPNRVFSLILKSLRSRFLASDLSASWSQTPARPSTPTITATAPAMTPVDFDLLSPAPSLSEEEVGSAWQATEIPLPPLPKPVVNSHSATPNFSVPPPSSPPQTPPKQERSFSRAFQLHNSYIVVETDEGMLLVDQHALHERILYQEMKSRLATGQIETQELLVPEPVEVTPIQAGLLLEHRETLAKLGIQLDEFGERCVLVRSHPILLQSTPLQSLIREVAATLEESGEAPESTAVLDSVLSMAACKAAVKAGDPLTPAEIDALLARRGLVEDSHHCPHGRPTVLKFTLHELERQFKRV
jgi:DNA mismatch repair protein MutL